MDDATKLDDIKRRHQACATNPDYPDIPESDRAMFNTLAHAHCIQVNEDRAWLLEFIERRFGGIH